MRYRRIPKAPPVHMLQERKGGAVRTRCRLDLTAKPNQALWEIDVTGWEIRVTCPDCRLPAAS